MNLKRMAYAATLTAGVAATGLFGVGLGTASADPGWGCGDQNGPGCHDGPGWHDNGRPDGNDWQHRGFDDARRDHQPFVYNGQRVEPLPAGNGIGWGFWFFGQWIPL